MTVTAGGEPVAALRTTADGTARFYPGCTARRRGLRDVAGGTATPVAAGETVAVTVDTRGPDGARRPRCAVPARRDGLDGRRDRPAEDDDRHGRRADRRVRHASRRALRDDAVPRRRRHVRDIDVRLHGRRRRRSAPRSAPWSPTVAGTTRRRSTRASPRRWPPRPGATRPRRCSSCSSSPMPHPRSPPGRRAVRGVHRDGCRPGASRSSRSPRRRATTKPKPCSARWRRRPGRASSSSPGAPTARRPAPTPTSPPPTTRSCRWTALVVRLVGEELAALGRHDVHPAPDDEPPTPPTNPPGQ